MASETSRSSKPKKGDFQEGDGVKVRDSIVSYDLNWLCISVQQTWPAAMILTNNWDETKTLTTYANEKNASNPSRPYPSCTFKLNNKLERNGTNHSTFANMTLPPQGHGSLL